MLSANFITRETAIPLHKEETASISKRSQNETGFEYALKMLFANFMRQSASGTRNNGTGTDVK